MAENSDDQSSPREERGPNVAIDVEAVGQLLSVLLLLYFDRPNIVLTLRLMQYTLLRLLTFLGFPRGRFLDIRDFVDAGLYYAGVSDHVYCCCCRFHRAQWISTDNPFDIHRRYAPNCPFFRRSNNVNLNSMFNLRRQRGTVPIRFEGLPGPTLDTNDQGIHPRIRSRMPQTEEYFEPNVLPTANLPIFEGSENYIQPTETTFSESNAAARNESETTSRNTDVDDSSHNSDSLSRNFSVSVRNEPEENNTARKAIVGCTNDQIATNFMITYPSPECSSVRIQPSSNGYSVSLLEMNENSITTAQQTQLENNSSTHIRNSYNDNTNNSDARCHSVWENSEGGAVATTNVSDDYLLNNNDVCVENSNDEKTLNSETRCQTNESCACAAATTNVSDVFEFNNNDAHVENPDNDNTLSSEARCLSVEMQNQSGAAAASNASIVFESKNHDVHVANVDDDDDDDDTLKAEARCHSVEEKNASGAAATINESSAEKRCESFKRSNETKDVHVEAVTQTEHTVNREGVEFIHGRAPGNQEKTEKPETDSIAGNNHQDNNYSHNIIQNDVFIHGLPRDSIKGVKGRNRQMEKGNPVVRNGRDNQKFCKKRPKQRYKQNGNSNRASSHPCSKVHDTPYPLDAGNHVERNGKDIKRPSTKRKPANRPKQRAKKDDNSSTASSQLCSKDFAERVPGIPFLSDKDSTETNNCDQRRGNVIKSHQEDKRCEKRAENERHNHHNEQVNDEPESSGNLEVTEMPEIISIAGNNLQENNSLPSDIQNNEATNGLPHDVIEGVGERHRPIETDKIALSSAETDRLPMSDIATKQEENGNRNDEMFQRQNVGIKESLGDKNIIDDTSHENAKTGDYRADNKVGVRTGQNDPKRNKVCTPSPKVVLPEDGSFSQGKDKTTAQIGRKKTCLPSNGVAPLEDRKHVDFNKVHAGKQPTATAAINFEDDADFVKYVENEIKEIKDPAKKLQKQQAIMKILGNG